MNVHAADPGSGRASRTNSYDARMSMEQELARIARQFRAVARTQDAAEKLYKPIPWCP